MKDTWKDWAVIVGVVLFLMVIGGSAVYIIYLDVKAKQAIIELNEKAK